MAIALPDGRRGQLLALAVTLVALAILWLGVIGPTLDWYTQRDEQLRRESAIARRMDAVVATLPTLRYEAEQSMQDSQVTTPLLSGASDAVAAATLQQAIDEMAASAGVRLASEEILPPQPAGNLRTIAVRVTVSAPWRGFVALLLELAQARTPMIADEVQVRGPPANGRNPETPVDASFTVTSYRISVGATQ